METANIKLTSSVGRELIDLEVAGQSRSIQIVFVQPKIIVIYLTNLIPIYVLAGEKLSWSHPHHRLLF